ncbi:hypothetical protein IFM89_001377 [Coptis chinensis]|uniref:Ribosomal protein S15 n=1 Tax=Coptis chinensis TaxID=261450 RepID=A0A835LLS4_9MAGN|nr:hypothetical protein IFM89_001377 [Coptis chinensis]
MGRFICTTITPGIGDRRRLCHTREVLQLGSKSQFKMLRRTSASLLGIESLIRLTHEIREDLYHFIKKVVAIRKHLERKRKDKDNKFRLIFVESKIHRLACYYKRTKKLPPVWKYKRMRHDLKAQAEVLILFANRLDGLLKYVLHPSNAFGPSFRVAFQPQSVLIFRRTM